MTEEQKYLAYAMKHAEIVSSLVAEDTSVDILYGNAGAILAFCSLYELTQKKRYIEYAIKTEKYLRQCLQQNEDEVFFSGQKMGKPYSGIAHGNSGVILAYGRLTQYIENVDYHKIMKGLLAYENRLFVERFERRNEIDAKMLDLPSWCHGDNGILFAYLLLNRITDSKYASELEVVLKHSDKIIEKIVIRKSMSLCHGNLGNLLMMKECIKMLQIETNRIERFENKIRKVVNGNEWLLPIEQFIYGFMQGISGIGYACLQMLETNCEIDA